MRKVLVCAVAVIGLFFVLQGGVLAEEIRIGFNLPMTGGIPDVGESSKQAAEMLKDDINNGGGLKVGDKTYKLRFLYEDNEEKAESATAAALKLITQNEVLALIGPQASKQAVPAGETADSFGTPMISPWSTNPNTTLNRPYVFRACFLDTFQGPVAANFATREFGATKAAVLYDIASDYPNGLANDFKHAFESRHGKGAIVAFETFTTKDSDFSAQLTNIAKSGADVLFVPQYYGEVPLIVKQARELGWDKPVLGSDSWGSGDLMGLCGDDCKGLFFTTHYSPVGAKGATKEFIDRYKDRYGKVPNDVAALTWDATRLLLQAIRNTGGLKGKLEKDRDAVRGRLAKIKDFEGITGRMSFTESGDPIKCAVVVKINDQGEYEFYKSVCPE